MPILSGYRIMWLFAMFDLPVTTSAQRKAAAGFRNNLLNLGFEMVQFSVYTRHCFSKEIVGALISKVENLAPKEGKVKVLSITDKQFENISHLGENINNPTIQKQLVLF